MNVNTSVRTILSGRGLIHKLQNLNAGFMFLFKDSRIGKGREEKCKGLRHVMELKTTHNGDDTDLDVAPQIHSSCYHSTQEAVRLTTQQELIPKKKK